MLLPAKQRTKKFYVGREYDPIKAGLDTSAASGAFLLDTELPATQMRAIQLKTALVATASLGRY